jgi:hypothetical protein
MQLRKASESPRVTVTQEFRRILAAEQDAARLPPGAFRRVQILVPPSPGIVTIMTPDPRFPDPATNISRAAGPNRIYKGTPYPPGAQIVVDVGPDQEIWCAATEGYAVVGLLISYFQSHMPTASLA